MKKNFILAVCGMFIGVFNGLFGGGGGMVGVPALKKFGGLPQKKAHATTMFVMLPISIASMVIYITRGGFDFAAGVWVIIGVIIGGVMGALLLKKLNANIVAVIFAVLMLAAGIKMLF